MTARPERSAAREPARNRCRCGHYPTAHLRVAPTPTGGGYQLEPTAPCAVCGESACARFTPSAEGRAP